MKEYSFFAMMARMKYIERWALMRNSDRENISEHSMEVAMLAHGLGIISKECCGRKVDLDKLVLISLYHDANEIITGDMPTPVKYHDSGILDAYKKVEEKANRKLLSLLPEYMQSYYEEIFFPKEGDEELWRIVKAADKLSALIKCIEEKKAGNREFSTAYQTIERALKKMEMEEVEIFMRDFLPSFDKTLDELQEL
ncbi:MAG: 5'-deoxynucleotidase [Eubacterium sp.]|nr:5'-deoxynucleotidase [Eubacterium sp.]